MAETETAFNPLESNTQEFPEVIGIKLPGAPMETHEATFAESHLIELDLEKYVDDFNGRVIGAYQEGKASAELPADLGVARSLIPAGTGALRDFSYIAPEIPRFDLEKCVGCMSCVTLCPDTAILGKAIPASKVEAALENIKDSSERAWVGSHWARTRKYFDLPQKKGNEGALFGIFIDPTKCKGCAECVQVCDELDYHALEMVKKDETTLPRYRWAFDVFRKIGPTPPEYINERALGSARLERQSTLGDRRRWRDVRHRFSESQPDAGKRHEHQSYGARYSGLFQHRRAGIHGNLWCAGGEDGGIRKICRGKMRTAKRAGADLSHASGSVRRTDDSSTHQPLL